MPDRVDNAAFNTPGELFGANATARRISNYLVAEPRVVTAFPPAPQRPRVLADFVTPHDVNTAAEPTYEVHTLIGPIGLVRAERIAAQHEDELWRPGGAVDSLTTDGPPLSVAALDQVASDLSLMGYLPAKLKPSRADVEAFGQPSRRKQLRAAAIGQYGIFAPQEQTVTRGSAALPSQRLVQPTPFQSSPYKDGCRPFFSNTVAGT